jgi:hypothetical protein
MTISIDLIGFIDYNSPECSSILSDVAHESTKISQILYVKVTNLAHRINRGDITGSAFSDYAPTKLKMGRLAGRS